MYSIIQTILNLKSSFKPKKEKPTFKRKSIPWYKEMYYSLWRVKDYIQDIPREIKFFYQRGKKGYCDRDVWNFHSYICEVISGATKELAESSHGCPSDMFKCKYPSSIYGEDDWCTVCKETYPECPACIEWQTVLLDISDGFKAYKDDIIEGGIVDSLYKNRELDWNFEEVEENSDLRKCNITVTPDISEEERAENWKKAEEADKKFKDEVGPKFIKHLSGMWD